MAIDTPTESDFFHFIYQRQLIWYKRFVLRQTAPWTNDSTLKTYKIINVYRELDKCTLYLLQKLRQTRDREAQLLNIIFYRFFNQYGLYERLGVEPFQRIDQTLARNLLAALESIKREGKPIFNNAYLISSGEQGKKKHETIVKNLQALDVLDLINKIDRAESGQQALEVLQTIPMVGPFLACEIWTDLSYIGFFKQGWTDNDFVNIGPGAQWGLDLLYGKISKRALQEKLTYLHTVQNSFLLKVHKELGENFSWHDIAYTQAFSHYPFLSLTNIEGSLCEFRKYWNISHGVGRRKYFRAIT